MNSKDNVLFFLVLGVSWLLYLISLFLPAFLLPWGRTMKGIVVLAYGWWGPFMGQFAWFANPLYVFSNIFLFSGKYSKAFVCGAIALLLALQSFTVKEIYENEGSSTKVLGLKVAFYVWLSALFIVTLVSFFYWRRIKLP